MELVDSSDVSTASVIDDLDQIQSENDALRTELHRSNGDRERYRRRAHRAESLQAEIDRLALSLREAERNTKEVIRLAEIAKSDLKKARESSFLWQEHAEELDKQVTSGLKQRFVEEETTFGATFVS